MKRALIVGTAMLGACSAIVGGKIGEAEVDEGCDLNFTITNAGPHGDDAFWFRVVKDAEVSFENMESFRLASVVAEPDIEVRVGKGFGAGQLKLSIPRSVGGFPARTALETKPQLEFIADRQTEDGPFGQFDPASTSLAASLSDEPLDPETRMTTSEDGADHFWAFEDLCLPTTDLTWNHATPFNAVSAPTVDTIGDANAPIPVAFVLLEDRRYMDATGMMETAPSPVEGEVEIHVLAADDGKTELIAASRVIVPPFEGNADTLSQTLVQLGDHARSVVLDSRLLEGVPADTEFTIEAIYDPDDTDGLDVDSDERTIVTNFTVDNTERCFGGGGAPTPADFLALKDACCLLSPRTTLGDYPDTLLCGIVAETSTDDLILPQTVVSAPQG